jgi:CRISPR-associated endoribonuclease Cas6
MDLCAVVLTLRVPHAEAPDTLPTWWGRAAHALLLNVIRQHDPALSAALHENNQRRPFTASTLMGRLQDGLQPDAAYQLRFTGLSAPVSELLRAAVAAGPVAEGATVELDRRPFEVVSATVAAASDYQTFAAAHLVSAEPPERRLRLTFTSPTAFANRGKTQPLPLPELVFGNLLERWNEFAPIAFPPEARQFAAEALALSRFELRSALAVNRGEGLRVGAVGRVTYTATSYDRYWLAVLHTLAAYAAYAGVGVSTASGMGQCQVG